MTDPRNIAHDKKVAQEKKHHHVEVAPGAEHAVQPGRKPHLVPKLDTAPSLSLAAVAETETPETPATP
jgi:hypothetical protein